MASTQQALGVDLNYTSDSSEAIYGGFDYTGDFVYTSILTDLEALLQSGVRIALYHGDAGMLEYDIVLPNSLGSTSNTTLTQFPTNQIS